MGFNLVSTLSKFNSSHFCAMFLNVVFEQTTEKTIKIDFLAKVFGVKESKNCTDAQHK